MRYLLMVAMMFIVVNMANAKDGYPDGGDAIQEYRGDSSYDSQEEDSIITITATGQGVAPSFANSPAQSFALAKRAATADAYRLIAERVKGVRINGKDTIKNMAIKSSVVNTKVAAMIRNAKVVETTFKDGMCEVQVEVDIDRNNFR